MSEGGLARLRAAVAARPDDPGPRLALGRALLRIGRNGVAAGAFREAARLAETDPEPHWLLGEALHAQGKIEAALEAYARAGARAGERAPQGNVQEADMPDADMPDAGGLWQRRAEALCAAPARLLGGRLSDDLLACLDHDALDHRALVAAGAAGLAARADFAALLGETAAIPALDDPVLSAPVLLALLARAVIPDHRFERWLTRLRAALLARPGANGPLACAVALQCHATDYLWAETEAETVAVAALEARVTGTDWPAVAILAAYRRLGETGLIAALSPPREAVPHPLFETLVQRHIDDPVAERAIAADIPALGTISDTTSLAVARQYEQSPYPRWTGLPAGRPLPAPVVLGALFPHLDDDPPILPEAPRILIAGCGTGLEAFMVQRRFAGAEILAIDLSRASLAYAVRRQRALGIGGITFAQADILDPTALQARFDIVISTGVLHHLRDPMVGWRLLRARLAPGGFMRIGLYSRRARAGIARVRAFARRRGFAATAAGIRAFRAAVQRAPAMPVDEIRMLGDFYAMAECRDLFFHVMEHGFTLPQIVDALEALELSFVGFELPDPEIRAAYAAESTGDPQRHSLESWDAFERRHPDTFKSMYQFWLRAR